MAPQARIRYYKELSEQNAREASEAAYENKKMKKKVKKIESELIKLRATLSTSVQMVTREQELKECHLSEGITKYCTPSAIFRQNEGGGSN